MKKMLQKVRKNCNIYLRIKSYIISGEGKDGYASNLIIDCNWRHRK